MKPSTLISQQVSLKSFSTSQLPPKSVNLSLTITNIKNKLTDLKTHSAEFEGVVPSKFGELRDQICNTRDPKVDGVTFHERVVLHRVATGAGPVPRGCVAHRQPRLRADQRDPPPRPHSLSLSSLSPGGDRAHAVPTHSIFEHTLFPHSLPLPTLSPHTVSF